MDEASEEMAVQLAAQAVIGKRVDQMESGFMMALDYMIQLAEKDQDDKVIISTLILGLCVMFCYLHDVSYLFVYANNQYSQNSHFIKIITMMIKVLIFHHKYYCY